MRQPAPHGTPEAGHTPPAGRPRARRSLAGLLIAAGLLLGLTPAASASVPPVHEFSGGIPAGSGPNVITQGPDGAMWFTQYGSDQIGRVTVDGTVSEYPTAGGPLSAGAHPSGIVTGPDGDLWFTEFGTGQIGRLDPVTGALVGEYTVPGGSSAQPEGITVGSDNALWFTAATGGYVGRIDPSAVSPGTSNGITVYPLFSAGTDRAAPVGIVSGPDGALWITVVATPIATAQGGASAGVVRLDPTAPPDGSGASFYPLPTGAGNPQGITVGADHHLWVAEYGAQQVAQVVPTAHANGTTVTITEYPTGSGSPLVGASAGDGKLYFTEQSTGLLQFDPTSHATALFGAGQGISGDATGDARDAAGNLWFTEFAAAKVGVVLLTGPPTPGAPTLAPAQPRQDQVESCDPDAAGWSHAPVFSYRWLLDGQPIDGATTGTYTPRATDVTHSLACEVTGTNAAGSAQAETSPVTVATAAAPPPGGPSGPTPGGPSGPTPGGPSGPTPGGPAAPTPGLTDETPAAHVGGVLTLSAASSTFAAGEHAASYSFGLGGDPSAAVTCPADDPVLNVVATHAFSTTATLTVMSDLGAIATTTLPVTVAGPSGLRTLGVPRGFAGPTRASPLNALGIVSSECMPASGNPPSRVRSVDVEHVKAEQDAPTTAAQTGGCADDVKVGIIDGVGCFQLVDATHPLPAAEAKLLCAHEKFCRPLRDSVGPPPLAFLAGAGGASSQRRSARAGRNATAGAAGSVGYDAIYFSTKPVGIDGLEVDPVNGGVVVLARAGVTGSNLKDSAYLLSSDAVVKVGGLPITLHVPDYGALAHQGSAAAQCGQSVAGAVSNGDLSGAGCLGSVRVPSVGDVQDLLPQIHGPIDLAVSPAKLGIELGEFQVPGNELPIPVIPSLPLSGTIKVNLTAVDAASVAVHVVLPGLLSDGQGHGLTGDTTLSIDNVHGLELTDLDIKVPSLAQLGLARLRNLEFAYRSPSFFEGKATIDLSDVIHGLVDADLIINRGSFQSGTLKYYSQAGDGFPLFGPLFLTQLTAGLTLNPVHVHGDVQLSVGPSVTNDGCGALGIHGSADIVFGNPWTLDASGEASLLCNDFGASKIFHADSDGHFSYGEHFSYAIPGIGSVDGDEFGQAYLALHNPLAGLQPNDQFDVQLDGKLAADINIHECVDLPWPVGQQCTGNIHFTPQVLGTLSLGWQNNHLVGGAGVCASLGVSLLGHTFGFDVGAGTDNLPAAVLGLGSGNLGALAGNFQILLDNCDIGKWRLLPPPVGFALARAHGTAPPPYRFTIPGGEKVAVVGIQGAGGAPEVRLVGPDGRQIIALSDGVNIDHGALVIRQPSSQQTLIEIPHAAAGRWTLEQAPSSAPVRSVESSQLLPPPVIRTRVSGHGAHRLLHYRISAQPGLAVTFLERVDRGASLIGTAHGTHGTIAFTPSIGSGAPRVILALLRRNGSAAPSLRVGRYTPGPLRPGRAAHITARRTRGAWRIHWRPGGLASAQQLTIRFADGVQVLLPATAHQRSLTVSRAIDTSAPVAIEIIALRGQTRGRPATVSARPRRRGAHRRA